MTRTATQIVWPEPERVALVESPISALGPTDVLIRTELSLVSPGTERAHLLALPNTPRSFPLHPGYSAVGRVLDVGSAVDDFLPGERVVSYTPHATHVVVDHRMVAAVPDDVTADQAAYTSLLAIALQGVRKAEIEIGISAAVLGGGMIGLFAAQWSRAAGASSTVVVDPVPERQVLAKELGADLVAAGTSSVGTAPSVVIDSTGEASAIIGALDLVARLGTVVILGSPRGVAENVDFYSTVHLKGISVVGAHDYIRPEADSTPGFWTWRRDAEVALAFLRSGRIAVDPIPSTTFPLSQVDEMYSGLLAGRTTMAMKIDWTDAGD